MTSISNCIHNDSLPLISSVFLVLTQACNLKCKYCFVVQKPKFMSYETAKLAADFVAENAKLENEVPSINFFGGEPLLMWNEIIVPLTKYIRESYGHSFNLSMTTNGLLLDEPKLMFMRKNNIGFMVSIDGDRVTQDVNRPCVNGESSFNIIGPRIPLFLRYNPNMTFRATIDHDNASAYLENHMFAYDQGYKNVFSIVNVFSKWSEEEKKILKCQIAKLGDFYLERLNNNEDFSVQPLEGMFYKIRLAEKAEIEKTFRVQGEQLPAYG